jgi:hypothetical protein
MEISGVSLPTSTPQQEAAPPPPRDAELENAVKEAQASDSNENSSEEQAERQADSSSGLGHHFDAHA